MGREKATANESVNITSIPLYRISVHLWITSLFFFALAFQACAIPVIESFAPAQGPPGMQVVIRGHNFTDTLQVEFNVTLADFTVVSAEQIVVVVPADALSGPITVVGQSGFSVTLVDFFVAPRIFEIVPPRSATNTVVNIFGENLEVATNVWFNGVKAAFQIVGPQQLSATVPFGATNGPVRVETSAGSAITETHFIVTGPEPIIDFVSPTVLPPGGIVSIEGANFIGVTSITISNVTLQVVALPAHSQLRAMVPINATNVVSAPIRLTTPRGTASSAQSLTITRLPVITDVAPTLGTEGQEVIITGLNFNNVTGVSFNGIRATGVGTPAENLISALVPPNATTGPIRVTNTLGVGLSPQPFVITRAPIVASFDQEFIRPTQQLTVRGANFTGATLVRFTGGTAAPSVVSGTQINVIVPTGANTGPISVVNPFGTNTTSPILIVTGTAPYVTEVFPPSGPRGEEVVISGANFNGVTAVRFNGVTALISPIADTQLRAIVPPAATSGRLTVVTPAGTSTNDVVFFVPPRLTSLTPTNGVVGTAITLRGTNFLGTGEVTIGGVPVPFEINASNTITATVTLDTRSGPVVVRAPAGDFINTNAFTVLPRIVSFSPQIGPEGTAVTITGTSFFAVQSVRFNDTTATAVQVRSAEEIVATVPAGATTGLIRVTTADGIATSTNNFIVTAVSDVAVTKTVALTVAPPGTTFTYSITVTNQGSSIQTGVIVTDTLPASAVFVSANSPRGPCTITNGVVTCALGALTNGTGLVLTLQAQINAEGVFTNRVSAAGVEADSNSSNNSAQAATLVTAEASRRLNISKVATNLVVISWPVSPVNFALQTTETLGPLVWTNMPAPPVVGGQNRFTNQVTEESRFYRLRREF